jgi:DNA-binding response OmpR family regulator
MTEVHGSATAGATAGAAPAHILVVDDVEKNTRLLADLLGARGYRTSTASSGTQALDKIDATAPDLVLLDVMMPGMSGYEVCRKLRADPRHALLPVVLVTALDPATERANGLDAGADDFLNKPINQAELLARVRSLLRVKALQDQLLRERAAQPAPEPPVRRGDVVVLCVSWPGLAAEAGHAEPGPLLAKLQALQYRLVAHAARHEGAVAGCHAQGMTVLFGDPRPQLDALQRALRLAAELQALGDGLAMGLAQGTVAVGALRLPGGGNESAALGPAVERAQQLSRQAAPGELRLGKELADAPQP